MKLKGISNKGFLRLSKKAQEGDLSSWRGSPDYDRTFEAVINTMFELSDQQGLMMSKDLVEWFETSIEDEMD